MTRLLRSGALACALFFATAPALMPLAALAQAAATVAPSPGVTIPYGQWIVDYGPTIASWAATAFAAVASVAIAKYAPWAASVATQDRVQMAAEALAQYAIRAIPDSVKDGKVTVAAGPDVIAKAAQRGVDVLPGRVFKAMEKGGGLASIVFRVLDLENGASEANVLRPAQAAIRSTARATGSDVLAKAA